MKNVKSNRGFTIVELLVVIVVIGILAAITIVSYSGVTTRARNTQAQSNANSAQSVAETYFADAGYYPVTTGAFTTGYVASPVAKLPAGVTMIVGLPGTSGTPFNGTEPLIAVGDTTKASTLGWACSGGTAVAGNCTGNTGGRITYWDFSTTARSTTVIYVGAANASSTFFSPAS